MQDLNEPSKKTTNSVQKTDNSVQKANQGKTEAGHKSTSLIEPIEFTTIH